VADLEKYVMGALAPERTGRLEAHVAECETCALALAREAQLEVALEAVAQHVEEDRPSGVRVVAHVACAPEAPAGAVAQVIALPVRPAARTRMPRVAFGLGGAMAAAAAFVLWMMPAGKADTSENVAKYGAVSADAAGTLVSFEQPPLDQPPLDQQRKPVDSLDGG
jgi:hypothetical protein